MDRKRRRQNHYERSTSSRRKQGRPIPVRITPYASRYPEDVLYSTADYNYRARTMTQPLLGRATDDITITDRRAFEPGPELLPDMYQLMRPLPEGLIALPQRPGYALTPVSLEWDEFTKQVVRAELMERLQKLDELITVIFERNEHRRLLWNATRNIYSGTLGAYSVYVACQNAVLDQFVPYKVGAVKNWLEKILDRESNQLGSPSQQLSIVNAMELPATEAYRMPLAFVRQATENVISDLEWYLAASEVFKHNVIYYRRLLRQAYPQYDTLPDLPV